MALTKMTHKSMEMFLFIRVTVLTVGNVTQSYLKDIFQLKQPLKERTVEMR